MPKERRTTSTPPPFPLSQRSQRAGSPGRHWNAHFKTAPIRSMRFTILDPVRWSRELVTMEWPGDIGSVTIKGHARYPPSSVAVTWCAPILAKDSGTTPEAIKAVIEKCEGIVY